MTTEPSRTTHTHLQLNVQRTMTQEHVTADLEHAFSLGADTVVFNEIETTWHRLEVARLAAVHGYGHFSPPGAAGAVVVAWRLEAGTVAYRKSILCATGMRGLSPNRYYNRVKFKRHDTGEYVAVSGTHMWSSGWTGTHDHDAIRRAHWHAHMWVMGPAFRRTTRHNVVSIGSGDLNRPPYTFRKGKVLTRLISPRGMVSAGYAHTDHTHGSETFDYVWFASRRVPVVVDSWSTPAFNSDHDGVLVTVSWPTSAAR